MKKCRSLAISVISLLIICTVFFVNGGSKPGYAAMPNLPLANSLQTLHEDGRVFTIKNKKDKLVSKMSRIVSVGDKIITNKGEIFRVDKVKGESATAVFLGTDGSFKAWQENLSNPSVPVLNQVSKKKKNNKVGIYHTHSEESYIPSDGKRSIPGNGGVFKVGETLAASFKKQGVEVIHEKADHGPRDKNAYNRSRRTASALLRKNPAAIIDIHRDGIPDPDYYNKTIKGKEATQLRLVIGRQNPNKESNKDFARKVMAEVNQQYPELIKEIFIGKGNYNQDLSPTALLVEAGTYTNERERAEQAIRFLGDALPGVLGIGKAGAQKGSYGDPKTNTPGGWLALLTILAIIVIGGGAYLVITSGGFSAAREKISKYSSKEFSHIFTPRRRK
ncbi:MAG: stage II sporulation protein P [Clostridiales bacterium]|nr:stage II sporulation protein P [Clostridiales bacterium]MCF8023230.1 stage II sporulation protein P [Clostridiales bacterium]